MNRLSNEKTYDLVVLSLMIAIEVILILTPLGYIPIGTIRATTLHIPVMLAAILLGYKGGVVLGFVFGTSSLIINTINPTPFSFIFSPFYTLGDVSGNFASIIIAYVPRIMIGLTACFLYRRLKDTRLSKGALPVAAFVSSMMNTGLVLLGIYIFFKDTYAEVQNVAASAMAAILLGQLSVNGVLEAIVAVVLVTLIGGVILKLQKSRK